MKPFLLQQLKSVFEGRPWYGEPVMDILTRIDASTAIKQCDGRSIILYVRHMIAWRDYALRQLRGESDFRIELGSEADWPREASCTEEDWTLVINALKINQLELIAAVEAFDDARWSEPVPGRKFSFEFMVNGVVQHDVYHLGQLRLLQAII